MTAALSLQYTLLKVVRNVRTNLLRGIGTVAVDDVDMADMTFETGESHTFTASTYMVLDMAQPLDVELTFHSPNNPDVVVHQDVGGLLILPLACTAVVSNPARFQYTSPVGVRVVTS